MIVFNETFKIKSMYYYINALATINGVTYSFNLKTYFGLDYYRQFLNEHLVVGTLTLNFCGNSEVLVMWSLEVSDY